MKYKVNASSVLGAGDKYAVAVQQFKTYLLDGIGSQGVHDKDTIEFVLKGKAGTDFGVSVKGRHEGHTRHVANMPNLI